MRAQAQQNGKIWVPLDAYEQLLEITQEELTSQLQRALTEQSMDRERRASRQQALLGPPQGDFVPPAREKLASPYPTIPRPKPSYRFAPTPDRPAYPAMGRPPRRPPPQPTLPPPPPLPTGPDPTSLNEELGQLSGMSMAGSSWAGSSREPDEDPAALAEEERLVAMVEDRLRRRPALHRRLQTAVLGALDDGTMGWGRVWEEQLQEAQQRNEQRELACAAARRQRHAAHEARQPGGDAVELESRANTEVSRATPATSEQMRARRKELGLLSTKEVDEEGSEAEWSPEKEKGAPRPPREQDPNELLAMIAQLGAVAKVAKRQLRARKSAGMAQHRGGGRDGRAPTRELHAEFGEGEGEGEGEGGGGGGGGGAPAAATRPHTAATKSQPALQPRARPASAAPRLAPPPQQQAQQRPASAARPPRRGGLPSRLQVPPRMELSSSAEIALLDRLDRPWLHLPTSAPSRPPALAKAPLAVPPRGSGRGGSARGGAALGASASAPALHLRARAPPAGGGGRQQKVVRAPAASAAVAPATALPHREQAPQNEALLRTGLPQPRGLDALSERVTSQRLELYRQQQHELGLAGDNGREYLE